MASEKARRRAGAQGTGASEELEHPDHDKRGENTETTVDQVQKILAPTVLKLDITRKAVDPDTGATFDKPFILAVPSKFTIGELVLKDAGHDFDAYIRLVLVELQRICPSPMLAFTSENMAYIDVVLMASNVRSFMARVVAKSAYVLDPEDPTEKKLTLRPSDLALTDGQTILIGASYVNRWVTERTEALRAQKEASDAKNAGGAAQT